MGAIELLGVVPMDPGTLFQFGIGGAFFVFMATLAYVSEHRAKAR